jgi:hypothetical protein
VRCREAEAGVHFIGLGRLWGGGEAAGGGGVLHLVDFEGVKGGTGDGAVSTYWANEEGGAPVRFGYSRAEESGRWWRTARWRDERGGGAVGSRRWETTSWWAVLGRKANWSRPVSVGVKERRKWAKRRNGLKAKEAAP